MKSKLLPSPLTNDSACVGPPPRGARWLSLLRLIAVGVLLASCSGGSPPSSSNAARSTDDDPPSITGLPGYSARLLDEPVFGGKVYVITAGPTTARPVLLVHGLGDEGSRHWYGLMEELAADRRVIALDLPGFARSTKANELYSPTRYVALLEWLLEQETDGTVDVVGHSLGGALSLLYASAHPERVRRLVLADAAGILERRVFVGHLVEAREGAMSKRMKKKGEVLGWMLPLLLTLTDSEETDPSEMLATAQMRERKLDGAPRRIAGMSLILHDFGPAIASVKAPTLLIWGEKDGIAPVRTGVLLDERMEDTRLEILEGVGHVPMRDAPELFEQKVGLFLRSPRVSPVTPEKEHEPPPSKPPHVSDRQHDRTYTGDFGKLEIRNGENITLRDARIQTLVIRSSTVSIERSTIRGAKIGLDVEGSEVRVTGGSIEAETAIRAEGSVIDLAGVSLAVEKNAVECTGSSQLVFSVCPLRRADGAIEHLHDFYPLQPGEDLKSRDEEQPKP